MDNMATKLHTLCNAFDFNVGGALHLNYLIHYSQRLILV